MGNLVVGNDTIDGGNGDDTIACGYGTDVVTGGAGNDIITLQDGTATIDAGSGNDTVVADRGHIVVTLGAGADTFTTAWTMYNLDFSAEIKDFTSGQDVLDLQHLGLTLEDRGVTWDIGQWGNQGVGIEFMVTDPFGGPTVTSSILLDGLTMGKFNIATDLRL